MNGKDYKTYLSGDSLYHYCPFCIKRLKNDNQFTNDIAKLKELLKPLIKHTLTEPFTKPGSEITEFYKESYYECPECHTNNINVNTFLKFYACRPDGTRYNEQPKTPAYKWSRKKNDWALFDWKGGNEWVERE